jgi:uncharacterized membrane protein
MSDWVIRLTALPNLHPAVVHFPIALLPLAMLTDVVSLVQRQQPFWERLATLLYLLGAAGAALAVRTGEQAADSLVGLPPKVQPHIGEHSDWAHYTLWLFGALAVLRLALFWRDRTRSEISWRAARLGLAVLAIAGTTVLARTADLGGALVFRHGLAVAAQSVRPASGAEPATPLANHLVESEDGSLLWVPGPSDSAALGSLLRSAPGASLEAVSWSGPGLTDAKGLGLEVAGRAWLLLPGTFGNVHLEVELALEGFEGTLGLAHHVRSAGDGGRFTVSIPSGETSLVGEGESTLGRGTAELPAGPFRLAVSAAGRHLKGLLNGETVVHGHEAAPPPGGCGLYLDGQGTLRLLSMRVLPLAG